MADFDKPLRRCGRQLLSLIHRKLLASIKNSRNENTIGPVMFLSEKILLPSTVDVEKSCKLICDTGTDGTLCGYIDHRTIAASLRFMRGVSARNRNIGMGRRLHVRHSGDCWPSSTSRRFSYGSRLRKKL